jgi:hypothetical protein
MQDKSFELKSPQAREKSPDRMKKGASRELDAPFYFTSYPQAQRFSDSAS